MGTWKVSEKEGGWVINFEPDGTISSAVVGMGAVEVVSGQEKTVLMRFGGKGIYKPGQWKVHYSPDSRELRVVIALDYLYLDMGPNALEGQTTDVFVGKVDENNKIWRGCCRKQYCH